MNEQWQDNTNDEAKRALAEWSHAVADETEVELQAIMSPEEYAWYRREMTGSIVDTTNTAEIVAKLRVERDALQAENERLQKEVEDKAQSQSYGYTVSIILPDGNPTTMPSKGINDHDALDLARIILERDYKDYPVRIVGISRVIF